MSMPNTQAVERAHSAIKRGHVDHGTWSAPDKSERKQDECLGPDLSYPVFVNGKLSKHALANAESRAVTNGHPEIARHARELLAKIGDKPAMAASDEPIMGVCIAFSSDYSEALMLGSDLPKTRNGKPCHYYWKEALRPGDFQDSYGRKWSFSASEMDEIVSEAKRAMKLASHEPSLDEKHPTKDNPLRGKNYGWVIDARKNAKGRLELLHQFVGDAETNEALNKKSSILLVPGKKDHLGNQYKWWIDQNAIVSNAQLRDLDPEYKPAFAAADGQTIDAGVLEMSSEDPQSTTNTTPALAAHGQTVDAVEPLAAKQKESTMDLKPLRDALGLSADKPDTDVLALAVTELATRESKALSLSDELETQKEANTVLATELTQAEQARDNALALASEPVTETVDPHLMAMANRLAVEVVGSALKDNRLTAAQAEYINGLRKNKPTLALSGDIAEGSSMIDSLIAFAALGNTARVTESVTPKPAINRGAPVAALPKPKVTPLALSGGDEPQGISLERRNELRANVGLPPLASV